MVNCAACGCTKTKTTDESHITFHRFPTKSMDQQLEWLNFVNRPNWKLPKMAYLCSQHFEEDCFDRTSTLKVQLKPNVLPTIQEVKYRRKKQSFREKLEKIKSVETQEIYNRSQAALGTSSFFLLPKTELETAQTSISCILSDSSQKRASGSTDFLVTESKNVLEIAQTSISCMSPDTPCKRALKRKISLLEERNKRKALKIRRLKKEAWFLKRRISMLNIALKEIKTIVLEEFQKNKD